MGLLSFLTQPKGGFRSRLQGPRGCECTCTFPLKTLRFSNFRGWQSGDVFPGFMGRGKVEEKAMFPLICGNISCLSQVPEVRKKFTPNPSAIFQAPAPRILNV